MANFSNDWALVFEKTLRQLAHLTGTKLDYLEVGIFEGQSAHRMFQHLLTNPESTYTGIDIWKYETREIAEENLKGYENKTIITDNSRVALEKFHKDEQQFDIVYIDGDHSYKSVLSDTVLTWGLTKQIMIWDDYKRPHSREYGVRAAVQAFLRNVPNSEYKVIVDDYQFAIQKLG